MATKTSARHPFAAVEHRVIDSEAYASLSYSARSLLILLARQLTRSNNGHLMATSAYLQRYGFSDRTITRGIQELIAVGLVCRTRCGGFHQGASQYAVTWLPVTQREGLFLEGFRLCAWRDWTPPKNKNTPANLRSISRKNGGLPPLAAAKFTAVPAAKFTDTELMPCRGPDSAQSNHRKSPLSVWRKFRLTGKRVEVLMTLPHRAKRHEKTDDAFTRATDDAPADTWDAEIGEFRKPVVRQSATRLWGHS